MNKTEAVTLGSESDKYGRLEDVLLYRAIQDEVAITFSEEEGEYSRKQRFNQRYKHELRSL